MGQRKVDVLLVGAGVMSATLGKLLSELDPELKGDDGGTPFARGGGKFACC